MGKVEIAVGGISVEVNGMSGSMVSSVGMPYDGDMYGEVGQPSGTKDPLLSSWLFVGGITAASLACSIVIGILFAKRKIKKGFDLYED